MLGRHRQQQQQLLRQCVACFSAANNPKKPPISQKVRFIDQLRVAARGGHGGGGSSALFGRTGHHPRAAGGNGAPGGAVILRASKQLTGLGSIPMHVEAARGGSGGKQWMEGRRGADKVVDVPLGTLVWQLVEMRHAPGSTALPHGVTPLPHTVAAAAAPAGSAAAAWRHMQPQPKVQQTHPAAGDGIDSSAPPGTSSSHSTGSPGRRRLFPDIGQQQQPQPPPQQQQQHDPSLAATAAAAAAAVEGCSSDEAEEDGLEDALFNELLSCRRRLTNAEKLWLLHNGSLPSRQQLQRQNAALLGPATAAEFADSGDDSDGDAGGNSESETEQLSDDEDQWVVLPPADEDAAAAAGAAGWLDSPERQFTKQQVWSILEAQAVLLGELTKDGQQLRVAVGGRGGRGNAVSPSKPYGPASRARSDGQPGQEVLLMLKLRLLADVVLVGLPNVGKSSLIAALTHARAQVGSYAFTTLRPQLGTITDDAAPDSSVDAHMRDDDSLHTTHALTSAAAASQPDPMAVAEAAAAATRGSSYHGLDAPSASAAPGAAAGDNPRRLVVADLPGLVPGAHIGKGRGTAFLAHLQRARCLALVLDMTGGSDQQGQQEAQIRAGPGSDLMDRSGRSSAVSALKAAGVESARGEDWGALVPFSPQEQLAILQKELGMFDATVMELPMVVVANKLDALPPPAAAAALQELKAATTLPIMLVSAKEGLGLQRLKSALHLLVFARNNDVES